MRADHPLLLPSLTVKRQDTKRPIELQGRLEETLCVTNRNVPRDRSGSAEKLNLDVLPFRGPTVFKKADLGPSVLQKDLLGPSVLKKARPGPSVLQKVYHSII
ncbi:hypothetical protein NDU88_004330 [Pleurodeles waltl]|uniref:Uncharacterized protein n=1 Tax=Pleurodeles waltl TaxID=8319 RepID=A0AAV7V4Z3_PLEWA|nr:hypothetical protein NDU88_004330 [Pleurodeles waltl]